MLLGKGAYTLNIFPYHSGLRQRHAHFQFIILRTQCDLDLVEEFTFP